VSEDAHLEMAYEDRFHVEDDDWDVDLVAELDFSDEDREDLEALLGEVDDGVNDGIGDYGAEVIDGGGWREIAKNVIDMSEYPEHVKAEARRMKL
jgi:hypothetical protein